jgi:molybdopterin-guanine dinucleotide biosynthesis protein A
VIAPEEITGVILCGGRASRLAGMEKTLAPAGALPLVAHVRSRLAPQVGALMISANQSHAQYAAWGDPVVADALPDQGPLGGVLTAMDRINTPYTFCCPGDAPLLSDRLVASLAEVLRASGARAAIPHDGEQTQQLFLLVETACRDTLRSYLGEGGRAVMGWLDRLPCAVLDAAAIHDSFLNVNTADDLHDARRRFTASPTPTILRDPT